jgi:hypothetical protein
MISNKGTFLAGEKDLPLTLLIFMIVIPAIYLGLIGPLNFLVLKMNPILTCPALDCNLDTLKLNLNVGYYTLMISVIFFFATILSSSIVLWLNSQNTYDKYNVYAARVISCGLGSISFLSLLVFVYILFIPSDSIERIFYDKATEILLNFTTYI